MGMRVWVCTYRCMHVHRGMCGCAPVGVHVWMCAHVDVWACMCGCTRVGRDRDVLDLPEATASAHTVFAKQVICFPGFVFLLPVGSEPSLKTKGT